MNRVTFAIAAKKKFLNDRLSAGLITQKRLDELNQELNFQWDEYVRFQQLKSLAVVSGKLSQEEGMTIYNFLGESGPDKVNSQPLEVKVVLTQILSELIK